MLDTHLNILHDHYKESFFYIREREKQRDRLFLILIFLYCFLAFQVQYPINFRGVVDEINILNTKLNLDSLPLPAFLSATWVFILTIVLRYCQTSVYVERQYSYIHKLEETISDTLCKENIYRREGKAHLDNYPVFLSWVWIYYTILIPFILITATVFFVCKEIKDLKHPLYNEIFDLLLALSIIISILLYKFLPLLYKFINRKNSQ